MAGDAKRCQSILHPCPKVSMDMLIGCREVCVSMANIQNGRHTSRQFCQPIVKRQLDIPTVRA